MPHDFDPARASLTELSAALRAGLPVGLQIVGARGRDDLVLSVARQFEQHRPWHPAWPVIG